MVQCPKLRVHRQDTVQKVSDCLMWVRHIGEDRQPGFHQSNPRALGYIFIQRRGRVSSGKTVCEILYRAVDERGQWYVMCDHAHKNPLGFIRGYLKRMTSSKESKGIGVINLPFWKIVCSETWSWVLKSRDEMRVNKAQANMYWLRMINGALTQKVAGWS